MLDRMTPEEFEERLLAEELDPLDDSWRQTGTLAAAIVNTIRQLAAGLAGRNLRETDYASPDDFIPKLKVEEKTKTKSKKASLTHVEAQLKAAYGGNR